MLVSYFKVHQSFGARLGSRFPGGAVRGKVRGVFPGGALAGIKTAGACRRRALADISSLAEALCSALAALVGLRDAVHLRDGFGDLLDSTRLLLAA